MGIPREGSEDSSGRDLPRGRGKSAGFRDGIRGTENGVFTLGYDFVGEACLVGNVDWYDDE